MGTERKMQLFAAFSSLETKMIDVSKKLKVNPSMYDSVNF